MSIIAFSGWGQKHDSLNAVIDGADHIDYGSFASIDALYESLAQSHQNVETVIGWSLGGQVAIRSIAQGAIKPQRLILIATPFQFVSNANLHAGRTRHEFEFIVDDFGNNAQAMLQGFFNYVALNDSHLKEVIASLKYTPKNPEKWHYWLEELGQFSCQTIDFTSFPKTLLIHGQQDAVIDVSQSSLFVPLLNQYKLEIIHDCAHAPHLHDSAQVRRLIQNFS